MLRDSHESTGTLKPVWAPGQKDRIHCLLQLFIKSVLPVTSESILAKNLLLSMYSIGRNVS